eukprot:CAMPEP_0182430538 /NCGR_PEP_ID=MMETSP1167-20130531/41525_1 /TAXON_ID=2988 /ORGANISM="Mallomonas Sp, Strain CCMP3275" /LENGTH=351 /DNA_ID=CAMNT_0024615765 /DNA_START=375 /DNA_END=1427 /DNA_ORIENTATION=-
MHFISPSDNDWHRWHGNWGSNTWRIPIITAETREAARPGYSEVRANEYEDHDEVLHSKVAQVADMIKISTNCVAYTGAGISTSAGIRDYASIALNSSFSTGSSPMTARPTLSHRVLANMCKASLLKYWIQQNHDGLPQKAGVPQWKVNEIHGSLYDPANPVVPMEASLRHDLLESVQEWAHKTDLCLAMGTSLSGMNADQIVTTISSKLRKQSWGREEGLQGVVIISVQCTPLDDLSTIRVFCDLDKFSHLLSQALQLDAILPSIESVSLNSYDSGSKGREYEAYDPAAILHENIFRLPYDSHTGRCLEASAEESAYMKLDLSTDQRVRITGGPYEGDEGEVVGRNAEGHW